MKKLILIAAFLFLSCPAFAEVELKNIIDKVELKNGIGYSFTDNKIVALSTFEIAKYKDFTFEAGYAGDADGADHRLIGAVKYDFGKIESLDLPVLRYVNPEIGLYAGAGRVDLTDGLGDGNNEFDVGLAVTLINIKF